MKSNYEISKIKGLDILMMTDDMGMGYLHTKAIPKCSVVWGRNEADKYEHISISPKDGKIPAWNEMCALKDLFFNEDEECVQIHPKAGQYINLKENCLHLWRRCDGTLY